MPRRQDRESLPDSGAGRTGLSADRFAPKKKCRTHAIVCAGCSSISRCPAFVSSLPDVARGVWSAVLGLHSTCEVVLKCNGSIARQ